MSCVSNCLLKAYVSQAFAKNGIRINEQSIEKICLPESVTNSYFQVEDSRKDNYLIQKNGMLWPPFTRN